MSAVRERTARYRVEDCFSWPEALFYRAVKFVGKQRSSQLNCTIREKFEGLAGAGGDSPWNYHVRDSSLL